MQAPPTPSNEQARLAVLRRYEILDTEVDAGIDDLTRLAARLCGTPIALVSLVDADRQWFKSRVGLDATETKRDVAFCAHAILEPEEVFAVPDAHEDARFFDNPLVTGGPRVRAYLGVPLVAPTGEAIGTLCVLDHVARTFGAEHLETIRVLGRQVVTHFELQKSCRDLAAAAKHAEAATRAKSEFLASMSHEIRTPMNGVLGMLELTLGRSLDATARGYVEVAQASAGHLLEIINDILDLSKIEANRLELELVPFALDELVRATLTPLAHRAEEKGIRLTTDISAAVPRMVLGDPLRIRQLLTNLVGNAIKFTAHGAVDITLRASASDRVTLSVSDTGIGIPPERQASIFEAFTQADSGIARKFGGTGLGLSICAHLVSLMRGTLSVESKVGEGSSFRCDLPLPASAPSVAKVPAHATPREARRLRVLVADDNEINVLVARRMLEKLGHTVVAAADGAKALAAIESEEFDVVLMDVQMPVMDGLTATRGIRAFESKRARSTPPVPIVALTASAMSSDALACEEAGMTGYLSKPFRLDELERTLEEATRERSRKAS